MNDLMHDGKLPIFEEYEGQLKDQERDEKIKQGCAKWTRTKTLAAGHRKQA